MPKREFFINAVQLVQVEGAKNVPTAVYYSPDSHRPLIGYAAMGAATRSRHLLNEDFKVDLGNVDPSSAKARRRFPTASGQTRSAAELADDFLNELIRHVKAWVETYGAQYATTILLAEPLAMHTGLVEADWLSNYRRTLERLIIGKGFDRVEFLPEPFAVFQYYRYGVRHPLVAQRMQHNALVLDFGGGTCDVCVISTTKEGDISNSGRNSRPLAAASEPVGGFFINRLIAADLFRKHYSRADRAQLNKGFDAHARWREGKGDLNTLDPRYRNFVLNLNEASYDVEDVKLTLCRSVHQWDLEAKLDFTAPIVLPEDPFKRDDTATISVRLAAQDFRTLFEQQVWRNRLRVLIAKAVERARDELRGAPISLVLLSGGSANIGWLARLIRRDFAGDLNDAEILQLPDFQEVVAKGLAVESARRFFSDQGDFAGVTYNRLNLLLDADKTGLSLLKFVPIVDGLPPLVDSPGVILPSASLLRVFIGKPMTWRVRLPRPPHRSLDYFFLRSSFDPTDISSLQNVEERTLHTPADVVFDQSLKVELTVQEDGTARPRFVYKSGRNEQETIAISGKPFFLDMTYGRSTAVPKAYIGLDFGTSNTSVSYVDQESVQVYQQRSGEESWRVLSDLVGTLPYPLAEPLGRYLGESDPDRLARFGREFLEGALAFLGYALFMEYCSSARPRSRLFRNFSQRSVGPLWRLVQDALGMTDRNLPLAAHCRELLAPEFNSVIDQAVEFLAQLKHEKARPEEHDMLRPVQIVANVAQKAFADWRFGYFEDVRRRPFSRDNEGRFRLAIGPPPFFRVASYVGQDTLSEEQAYLVHAPTNRALRMTPLAFWRACDKHLDLDAGHCYLLDKVERDGIVSYKAIGSSCSLTAAADNEYASLFEELAKWREGDPELAWQVPGTIKFALE